jgi:uncharacterized FAD-dependent dehydrogenase
VVVATSEIGRVVIYSMRPNSRNERKGEPRSRRFVIDANREALPAFERQIYGFNRADALLTGVETRTSSPLHIARRRDFQSLKVRELYPAGEGAGYVGGIMSAGLDGIEVTEALGREVLGVGDSG